jgi:nitrate/nitrite-specific signal transduction histidine kinase
MCQFCHLGDARPGKQSAIVETADDHSALFSINLIYNQPQCQSCHLPQEKILGLTMIAVPLDDLNNQVASGFWRIVFSAVFMFFLLIVLMTLAFRQLIIQPIDKLTQGMMQIRDGNLNYEFEHPSRDEFGKLASAFDAMRRQLAAVQTENTNLNKSMRSLGILEERDRLARELHDNLAQMLGYINLRASLTDDLLAQNQIAPARESLRELKRIGKEAYTDVREAIFNLRIAMSSQTGLVPLLQDYLIEYREQTGINARLLIEDARLGRFPGDVEVQLNRVIQEALTNVRKHSGAKQAWIRFRQENNHIQITIEDNGKGFDPLHLNSAQHFGLAIMRERAESVGGEFQIASQPGLGTKIMLQVPRMPLIEDPHENTTYFAG